MFLQVVETGSLSALIVIAILIYFIPAIVGRKKRAATAIFVLNLLLGTTGIFWIIALVWALTPDPQPIIIQNPQSGIQNQSSFEAAQMLVQPSGSNRWKNFALVGGGVLWTLALCGVLFYKWQEKQKSTENIKQIMVTASPSPLPSVSPTVTPTPIATPSLEVAISEPTPEPTATATPIIQEEEKEKKEPIQVLADATPTPEKKCYENGVKVPCS